MTNSNLLQHVVMHGKPISSCCKVHPLIDNQLLELTSMIT